MNSALSWIVSRTSMDAVSGSTEITATFGAGPVGSEQPTNSTVPTVAHHSSALIAPRLPCVVLARQGTSEHATSVSRRTVCAEGVRRALGAARRSGSRLQPIRMYQGPGSRAAEGAD